MLHFVPRHARRFGAALAVALISSAVTAGAEALPADEAIAATESQVRAVFFANNTGWITDGTRAGTRPLRGANYGAPYDFVDLGDGRVAFSGLYLDPRTNLPSREPFITDGTRAGTRMVRYFGLGQDSAPRGYATLGDGRFVFAARNARFVPSVWVSDGTRRGTEVVAAFPAVTTQFPRDLTPLREGAAVFVASDGTRGWELWVTDGTREGTRIVRNITGDERHSNPEQLVQIAEGVVVFTADDRVNGRELWVTDGKRAGTRMLFTRPGSTGSQPAHITAIGGGQAMFAASLPGTSLELWVTDGTPEGTRMINDPESPERARIPQDFAPLVDGRVLFAASSDGMWYQLWVTDGTLAGTRIVRDIARQRPEHIRALGDGHAVFWIPQDPGSGGYALWVSDGTPRGTSRVQFFPNMDWTIAPRLTSMGNGLALFAYDNGRTGREPWVTDGTRAGTGLLRNINRGGSSDAGSFTPFVPAAD